MSTDFIPSSQDFQNPGRAQRVALQVGRAAQVVAFSAGVCAALGATAFVVGSFESWIEDLFFGGMLGSFAGVLMSPVVVIALSRRPLRYAALFMYPPAAPVAVLGWLCPHAEFALLAFPSSCTMAIVAGLLLPGLKRRVEPGHCARCGNDMTGLSVCPECGQDAADPAPRARPFRELRIAAALALTLVGVVLPLVGIAYVTVVDG